MIVKSFVGQCLLLAGLMMIVPVFAQQPTFPMLQDGGARSAFVGGTYRTCLEKQQAAAENATLSKQNSVRFASAMAGQLQM